MLLIAAMLWTALQQTAVAVASTRVLAGAVVVPAKPGGARTPTACLGSVFRVAWRWLRPRMRLLCHCLVRSFAYYVTQMAELRL